MEVGETRCSLGYGKPPWLFKGSALYQLHLVKAETARAFIPKDFRLVEAFGLSYLLPRMLALVVSFSNFHFNLQPEFSSCRYTLGGFFLASYDDSPAGVFDELVVIAGIVWNPPTSCAWAARVLVNSVEACDHGRKDVGLPSQVARFSKRITAVPRQSNGKFSDFLNKIGLGTNLCHPENCMDVRVTEIEGPSATDICNIRLTTNVPASEVSKCRGAAIKLSLPSFSGHTKYNPKLLKYSCQIECRVRAVMPAKVSTPSPVSENKAEESVGHCCEPMGGAEQLGDSRSRDLSISVMLSKPILALEFKCLKMQVENPTVVSLSHRLESSLGAA